MVTTPGRLVTYGEGKPCIKLHEALMTWLYEVIRQMKIKISPLPQALWSQNVAGW